MKIAVAGKGGSGKTTIAGTLSRLLARQGAQELLAIDADSNPNLALTLGIDREQAPALPPMPREILAPVTDMAGKTQLALSKPPAEIVAQYGIAAPDGVTLLLMGRVEHAGVG
jgi:CO dehydrogenase maturation factor